MMSTRKPGIRGMIPALAAVLLLSFSARQLCAQNAAENRTAAPSTGTISGRITTLSGEKISGAIVSAIPIGVIAQSRVIPVDSNGDFRFDGLEPGVYAIAGNLPGFVTAPRLPPDERRAYYRLGDSVTLSLIKGGVITGTVTTAANAPVVAASVRALRVRDSNGKPDQFVTQVREKQTDDRGVYRFYGLPSGTYIVSAGGSGRVFGGIAPGAHDNDAPTYAPSATRQTAMEIVVGSGEEIIADIQYRGEAGQVISGTLSGTGLADPQAIGSPLSQITLTEVHSRTILMYASTSPRTNNTFAFYGVPVGEYELFGQQSLPTRDILISEPRRIRIQGADVTGINLNLAPLAGITGRVVLESNPPAPCVRRRATAMQESIVTALRLKPETKPVASKTAKTEPPVVIPLSPLNQGASGVPDTKGGFLLRNLQAGTYRIDAELPEAGWYLRSIAIGTSYPVKASDLKVAGDGITLKSAERLSGLTVTITEGAGGLRGRISVAEGQRAPAGLRVYLVPAEPEAAENVFRFFDAPAAGDASFAIGNIPPGRYWIVARPADGDSAAAKPLRQDSALRATVLREAGDAKKEVLLQRCERVADYDLPYPLAAAKP